MKQTKKKKSTDFRFIVQGPRVQCLFESFLIYGKGTLKTTQQITGSKLGSVE